MDFFLPNSDNTLEQEKPSGVEKNLGSKISILQCDLEAIFLTFKKVYKNS